MIVFFHFVFFSALISFQRDRMLKLKQDLETESRNLRKLRSNVNQMEKNMLENRRTRNTNCFPSVSNSDWYSHNFMANPKVCHSSLYDCEHFAIVLYGSVLIHVIFIIVFVNT